MKVAAVSVGGWHTLGSSSSLYLSALLNSSRYCISVPLLKMFSMSNMHCSCYVVPVSLYTALSLPEGYREVCGNALGSKL